MTDARSAAWCLAGAATFAAALTLALFAAPVAPEPLARAIGAVAVLAAFGFFYGRVRPVPVIADATAGLVTVVWCAMMAGVIGLVGLGARAPLVDPVLAGWDAALGLDTRPFVAAVAARPHLGRVLAFAYESSVALVCATILLLAWTGRRAELWRFVLVFAATVLVCAVVSVVAPAEGAFAHYATPATILGGLPAGSGLYHLPKFEAYRSGAVSLVDFGQLQGVATFPSFHICMALATAWALRRVPLIGPLGCAWNGVVLVSTIPIGGHYAVDLIAGAALWAVATTLSPGGDEASAADPGRAVPAAGRAVPAPADYRCTPIMADKPPSTGRTAPVT